MRRRPHATTEAERQQILRAVAAGAVTQFAEGVSGNPQALRWWEMRRLGTPTESAAPEDGG